MSKSDYMSIWWQAPLLFDLLSELVVEGRENLAGFGGRFISCLFEETFGHVAFGIIEIGWNNGIRDPLVEWLS